MSYSDTPHPPTEARWLHRFALLLVLCTACLIFAGGLVTSTGSGLAMPEWPLSHGQVMPAALGGSLFDQGHRLIAATVGTLTIVLAVWLHSFEKRRWMRALGWVALGLVVAQGVLGGITVLYFLPTPVSVGHAGTAELFFAVVTAIAVFTSPGWKSPNVYADRKTTVSFSLLTTLTAAVIFVEILLGALMRHTVAGLAIPDFPLAFGRIIPPLGDPAVAIHFAHRVVAVAMTGLILWVLARVLRAHGHHPELRNPAMLLVALLSGEIALGAVTVFSARAILPTTLHMVAGASMWVLSVVLALRARRHLAPAAAEASARVRMEGAHA